MKTGGKWRNDRKKVGKKGGKSLKTGGKWRNIEECQEKGRKRTTENEGKSLKTSEKWRKMEENGGMTGKR